jgi:hypothetical protein
MAGYSFGPDGVVNSTTGVNMLDEGNVWENNGHHVRERGGGIYETTYYFTGTTGGYPSCPNKVQFHTLGFITRGGAQQFHVRIVSDHRGMSYGGYYNEGNLYASAHGDGLYYKASWMGASWRTGLLLPDADPQANGNTKNLYRYHEFSGAGQSGTDATQETFITATNIGRSGYWNYHRLCFFHYPHCGADHTLKAHVQWRGGRNGFVPYYQATNENTYTNVSSCISNSASSLPDIYYMSLPSGVNTV